MNIKCTECEFYLGNNLCSPESKGKWIGGNIKLINPNSEDYCPFQLKKGSIQKDIQLEFDLEGLT